MPSVESLESLLDLEDGNAPATPKREADRRTDGQMQPDCLDETALSVIGSVSVNLDCWATRGLMSLHLDKLVGQRGSNICVLGGFSSGVDVELVLSLKGIVERVLPLCFWGQRWGRSFHYLQIVFCASVWQLPWFHLIYLLIAM